MAKNRVFISYDPDNDKASKDRLVQWDKSKEYDFSSYDPPLGIACDSKEAAAIKQDIAARIGNSTHFLCLIGKETYRSTWAAWEARKAVELKKKLVAIKTDSVNNSPTSLQGVGARWGTMFDLDAIKKAIDAV